MAKVSITHYALAQTVSPFVVIQREISKTRHQNFIVFSFLNCYNFGKKSKCEKPPLWQIDDFVIIHEITKKGISIFKNIGVEKITCKVFSS